MRHSQSYRKMVGMLLGMLALSVSSCEDDFDKHRNVSGALSFMVEVSDGWSDGAASSSTSIKRMSQSADAKPLYLVTQICDSAPVDVDAEAVTRGTPVTDTDPLKTNGFGLSAICYTGTWPEGDSENNWTTNFAHNLKVTWWEAGQWKTSEKLEWPGSGNIKFFAYYPYSDSDNAESENPDSENTKNCITHSGSSETGIPVLTYTVPDDVTKQPDLLWAVADCSGKGGSSVELKFQHALTAVTIKTGKEMLSGKITRIKLEGVYGEGKGKIGDTNNTWDTTESTIKNFEIKMEKGVELPVEKDENGVGINTKPGTPVTDGEYTFMMVPQTLPKDAKLIISFTDELTNTERRLTANIGDTTWPSGKKVTYSISSSGIHIDAEVNLSKKGATDDNPNGAVIPYSGVWYDATYKAQVKVTQEGAETKTIDIPKDKIKFQYSFDKKEWKDCEQDGEGLLTIAAQPAYETMNKEFVKDSKVGREGSPHSLPSDYSGETANCYLVDKAGYYSLPLVYGNGYLNLPGNNSDGFVYFPKHDDTKIDVKEISDVEDAVLCWQDAPDLIDPASVRLDDEKKNLVFRIRKHTLAQGNAVVAVRDNSSPKNILWSWHIWVTPYKEDFYNPGMFYKSKTYWDSDKKELLKEYDFAQYNLGWCDHHDHNESRTFSLRAVINLSDVDDKEIKIIEDIPGTFTQMEFKGSDAGDNTYYQWGRKDPMLGGIYNRKTPKYQYKSKGTTSLKTDELTMENKQVFNQYNQDGYNYSFCKNLGDGIDKELKDYASNGVTIGYSIQHPYMFITNSRCNDGGDNPKPDFNYRNHWHRPYAKFPVDYLNDGTHIMFNAWDAGATSAGVSNPTKLEEYYSYVFDGNGTIIANVRDAYRNTYAADVQKSVYDPCPPKFKVPPIDAFRGIAQAKPKNDDYYGFGTVTFPNNGNACKVTYDDGQSIEFPITGVRDYALRNNEWTTVEPIVADSKFDKKEFYKISMPAFNMLSFVSSATLVKKESYNAYQLLILAIDRVDRAKPYSTTNIKMSCFTTSSNSYGLPVRPIYDKD